MYFLYFWMGGNLRGLYEGKAYKIIVPITKTLLKDLIYFSRNLFKNIQLIITKSSFLVIQ